MKDEQEDCRVESSAANCPSVVISPTRVPEDGWWFSQVLSVQIDAGSDMFWGNHTPGICGMLREIADALEEFGVQTSQYLWHVKDGSTIVARVDFIEESQKAAQDNPTIETTGEPSES